jgi:predicted pyridoxine 5'-phosphate oxidase superfamily flavin-nucleotide-binding protein
MDKIENKCREVLEKGEWVAIATMGTDGPHLAGTWGDYIRALGISETELRIPVAGYRKTEQNLAQNNAIELLCGTRLVEGAHGPGKGCRIRGRGRITTSGDQAEAAKKQFTWARGVLIVTVEEALPQL